jgi:hypothetical protein
MPYNQHSAGGSVAADIRPKWLDAIELADDDAKLLATVSDADQSAVQGLLRRHEITDPGLQSERARVIREALEGGRLQPTDLVAWRDHVVAVDAAIESITDFRKRHVLIEEFRAGHKLPPGNDASVLTSIRETLWRGDLPLHEWVSFLDKRRGETDRHLFLFRLPRADFVPPAARPSFTWKTDQPVLVDWSGDPAGNNLILCLVGWRLLARPGAKARRTVTFAYVDLGRGTMHLQLQRMRGGGMLALLAERDLYLEAVASLLHVRPEPLRLEPAIRALLADKRMILRYWMVRTPDGGELSGKGEPGLFERARLGFERFYALELRGRWKPAPTKDITIWMSARTDTIDVRTQCEPALVNDFLSAVYDQIEGAPPVTTASLQEVSSEPEDSKRHTELKALLEKVVEYQRRLGEDVAIAHPSRQTTNDLLFSPATLQEALDRFGVRSLGLTLYVMCPRTRTPIRQNGHIVEYERPGDVPSEIACENEGEIRTHPTKDNVWLNVGTPTSKSGTSPRLAWIAFGTFFAALTWFFVWLRDTYPKQQGFLLVGYLLGALAPIAAIRWLYGDRAFAAAAEMTRGLLDSILRKKQGGAGAVEGVETDDDEDR